MSFLPPDKLASLTRTAAYQEFLFQDKPAPGHYMNHLDAMSNMALDAALWEIFHALSYVFDAYPNLSCIRPQWSPAVDEGEFRVQVFLEVKMNDPKGNPGHRQVCTYGFFPLEIGENTKVFADLFEACEAIHPGVWETFRYTHLATLKEPISSKDQIPPLMESDLAEFPTLFQQWALQQTTPKAPSISRRKNL